MPGRQELVSTLDLNSRLPALQLHRMTHHGSVATPPGVLTKHPFLPTMAEPLASKKRCPICALFYSGRGCLSTPLIRNQILLWRAWRKLSLSGSLHLRLSGFPAALVGGPTPECLISNCLFFSGEGFAETFSPHPKPQIRNAHSSPWLEARGLLGGMLSIRDASRRSL
jgi:hypothetical protein